MNIVALVTAATLLSPSPPAALAAPICNRYCDGREAALASADRVPVSTSIYGRVIKTHVDDTDAMAWASLENGSAGDEVWLDRSFDGGQSWADGAKLGDTSAATRTGQFNVDDWGGNGVGALRACGKAGDRAEIACTAWTRSTWNAWDRRTAAATALMMRFDRSTGLFDHDGWWTGANALTAIIDNARRSGMNSYRYAVASTYDKQVTARLGQFRNEYLDDTGWWGLAWVAAYDLTGDSRYLTTARADAEWMHSYWDTRCGGGVYWSTARTVKNAIPNSLYIQLNAALSSRISGDTVYRQRAQAGWTWFRGTGMLNGSDLVNDGVDLGTCKNNGDVTWTYNQGVLINALVQLNRLTGDSGLLSTARRIGDAMTTSAYLSPGGILREPNEPDTCTGDGVSFKGAAIRGLGVLNRVTGGAYDDYLRRNADSAVGKDRNSIDAYGSHWAGPYLSTGHGCQHSAVDLLNAAP
ncbi:glycoside hydrolase family 76 protein [Paractinoplanes ferrugineus]|uniref:Glycosyl hydrolase n=1 Tax=Paractinoplanes ferrugineus TaxID=113564 RepID=A0A919IYV4_9ACTN|nr:glycoside hydrolase family 76 protein [Actinoplanes ferrugineus]GIE10422.1 glycosyl hydrolase [Actinoplanes ferrugineus]